MIPSGAKDYGFQVCCLQHAFHSAAEIIMERVDIQIILLAHVFCESQDLWKVVLTLKHKTADTLQACNTDVFEQLANCDSSSCRISTHVI